MGRNTSGFFSMLCKLEDEVLVRGINPSGAPYTELSKTTLRTLIKFVTSGSWTDSKVFKFLAVYYRESYQNLVYYWNIKYGNLKSESTFRNQKMKASTQLETMLGSVYSIESAFFAESDELLTNLTLRIQSLSSCDFGIASFVDGNLLVKIAAERDHSKTFDLKDCTKEIGFLVSLCYENINKCIETLDMQKLGYICSILQSPILCNGKINEDKINLVSRLHSGMNGSTLDMRITVANFAKSFIAESESETISNLEQRCEELERENMSLRMQLDEGGGTDTVAVGDLNIPVAVFDAVASAETIDLGNKSVEERRADLKSASAFLAAISCCDVYLMRSLTESINPELLSKIKWFLFSSDEATRGKIYDFMSNIRESIIEDKSLFTDFVVKLSMISSNNHGSN